MNYPVSGILEQVKAGTIEIETAVDVINIYIETSRKKGYSEGELDTIKSCLEVTGGRTMDGQGQDRTKYQVNTWRD